jgi:aspartate kinase
MLELASLGAQVMQSRSIEVAHKYNVPLYVRSSINNKPGTLITREVKKMEQVLVSGIALNRNEAKVTIFKVPDRPGIASKIFKKIADHNINVDMIIQNKTASNFTDISFTIMKSEMRKALPVVKEAARSVKARSVLTDENIAKISVVGVGMKSHSGVASKMFSALADSKINIDMISTSEIKISCVIDKKKAEKAMNAIHKRFNLDKKVRK